MFKAERKNSFCSKPFDDPSVLSANVIALEAHKVNLMESRFFALGFESVTGVDEVLSELEKIGHDVGLGDGSGFLKVDFKDREVELNRLLLGTKAIEQVVSLAQSSQALLLEKSNKKESYGLKANQVHVCLERFVSFLSNSKACLEKSINQVVRTNIKIASAGEKLKQLKLEWHPI